MNRLVINHITKAIRKNVILSDINYTFNSGNIYAVGGINGSGKTMLLRLLAGFIIPDTGSVLLNSTNYIQEKKFLPNSGILIENPSFPRNLTAFENLNMLAKINRRANEEMIQDALRHVNFDPSDKRKYKDFSLGMRQKIAVAQAFMEQPDIILLDEPTNALDEESLGILGDFLIHYKQDRIIIIASHQRDFVEDIADYTLQMDKGKLV